MGRLARLVLARISVVLGLLVLVALLPGLAILRTPRWRSPVVAATANGLLLGWLDGRDGAAAIRVQSFDRDLNARGPARRYGVAPASSRLALWGDGADLRLVLLGDGPESAVWVGAFDSDGRRQEPDGALHPRRWPLRTVRAPEGYRVLLDASSPWLPSSGAWARRSPHRSALMAFDRRGQLRGFLEPSLSRWEAHALDRGVSPVPLERAHCPLLATYGCMAATADNRGLVAAWLRNRSLGDELVLTRISWNSHGAPRTREVVLAREQSVALVGTLSGLIAILLALIAHAAGRAWSAARIVRLLGRSATDTWVEGRLDDPRSDLVLDANAPRSHAFATAAWRMRTAAVWLSLPDGERVLLRGGTPVVVTLAAIRGELPAQAAAVASFDRAYAAGRFSSSDEIGAYRGGAVNALSLEVLSDAPLPRVRSLLMASVACAVLDLLSLGAVSALAAWVAAS